MPRSTPTQQQQLVTRANIRIDGDPRAVLVLTEALRTLLGPTAQIGTAQPSRSDKYAGSALTRGTADAYQAAARAADLADLEQAAQPTAPKERRA